MSIITESMPARYLGGNHESACQRAFFYFWPYLYSLRPFGMRSLVSSTPRVKDDPDSGAGRTQYAGFHCKLYRPLTSCSFRMPARCSTRFLFIFYVAAATISPHGMVFAEVVGHDDKVSMPDQSYALSTESSDFLTKTPSKS